MNKYKFLTGLVLFLISYAAAAQKVSFKGSITDCKGLPLAGSHVHINKTCVVANDSGMFKHSIKTGRYTLEFSHIGYNTEQKTLQLVKDTFINVMLTASVIETEEVTVQASHKDYLRKTESRSIEIIDEEMLKSFTGGSLMQSLENLPGINSVSIGSGQSKPIIRGLSFNRVSVSEHGIKHQSQQWGTDHGLEIDQNAAEEIRVLKGPASLQHGSDALGGVILINPGFRIPKKGTRKIELGSSYKSNNDFAGLRLKAVLRTGSFYHKLKASGSSYADYKVPTDSIEYYSYYFRLKDRRLRNTAGREAGFNWTSGFTGNNLKTALTYSRLQSKSGFFANAHGLEIRLSDIDYDASARDIDLPFQTVLHQKLISNTQLYLGKGNSILIDAAWQNNKRGEFSEASEHGYMPMPPDSTERKFYKNTYSLNVRWKLPPVKSHSLQAGINSELQENRIGGWGFILPEFSRKTAGLFVFDKIRISKSSLLQAGMRYDFAEVKVQSYTDWFPSLQDDDSGETFWKYLQRSPDSLLHFGSFSWSLGYNHNFAHLSLRANIGKSFRIPGVKELAADGINYHFYQYEDGNINLQAETAYQADLGADYRMGDFELGISAFTGYFPNYIYLNPSGGYKQAMLYFQYTESRVFRTGGELKLKIPFGETFEGELTGEYLYSLQLSGTKEGFGLPFAPPPAVGLKPVWKPKDFSIFRKMRFYLQADYTAAQDRIVPPEIKTPASLIFSGGFLSRLIIGKQKVDFLFRVGNILDTKYYKHTNFYRLIDVPEPGRNLIVRIDLPINLSN